MAATNLFIAGCPRSGTTALTRLVNLHPDIVIGLERFKGLYGKRREFTPELFTPERFFDFREADTNFHPEASEEAAAFYANAQAKFADAKFVGDKYPQYFRLYDHLFRQFPDAKVVFIFRDPAFVAQSWQRRAEDSTRWPAENDGRKAATYWNDSLAYTLAYTAIKRNAFIFVEYESFFNARADGLIELLNRIGAPMDEAIEAQVRAAAVQEYARTSEVISQSLDLPKDVAKSVRNNADLNLLRRAKRVMEAQKNG